MNDVIHLILARIKGAPSGTKGISLFLVPKFRPDEQVNLMDNDVIVTQVFHKLGYRGAPILWDCAWGKRETAPSKCVAKL